ncbi:hypothetical protein DUNSADRAFT_12883 [Dunaliella salina]|uniref:Uncharacterized protein n=1 Tax=Dunaliella salina TaxID=3046 RepID=A0ABQ7H3J6_DUNSA|nr:hypothetical protein DUNSADRAFT_12883 [Dunaliella salina]|eukprot:KAF5841439.1 hypothetical protein DUNSADRAFT_12883 [Dunaliella salina]
MAKKDAAESLQRDQEVSGRLRKGFEGYFESHPPPDSSGGRHLLTRTRVSGDGSSKEDETGGKQWGQVKQATLKLQKEHEQGGTSASQIQLSASGAQVNDAFGTAAAAEAHTLGQSAPDEAQKGGGGAGPEASFPAGPPGQTSSKDSGVLQPSPSQTDSMDPGTLQPWQGSSEGAVGPSGQAADGGMPGGSEGGAEPMLTSRKSVFWQAFQSSFHVAKSVSVVEGVDEAQQQQEAEEEGDQPGHHQTDAQGGTTSKEASAPDTSVAYRRRPPVPRPTFVATSHELSVFLGGHLKQAPSFGRLNSVGRQPPAPSPEASAASEEGTEPAAGAVSSAAAPAGGDDEQQGGGLAVDTEQEELQGRWSPIHGGSREAFEAVFDPSRVLRSDSQRRAHLLDGYDLRHELRELLQEGQEAGPSSHVRAGDGDYSNLALAGAEAVLFGHRNLSAFMRLLLGLSSQEGAWHWGALLCSSALSITMAAPLRALMIFKPEWLYHSKLHMCLDAWSLLVQMLVPLQVAVFGCLWLAAANACATANYSTWMPSGRLAAEDSA